jgi:hypothetical protein
VRHWSSGQRRIERGRLQGAGIYYYICTPHPWMYGQIIVENRGGARRNARRHHLARWKGAAVMMCRAPLAVFPLSRRASLRLPTL